MRLEQYLNESINIFDKKELKRAKEILETKVIPLIEKNCKPFLKEIKGASDHIYRGTNKPVDVFGKFNTHKKRKPIGTLSIQNKYYIGERLKEKFGWNPRFENTVFTFSNQAVWNYGTGYIFFPIGDFKYIWSPLVYDLNVYFREHEFDKNVDKVIKSYTNRDIKKAIKSKNEISFYCKSYYLVDALFRGSGSILSKKVLK